MDHDSPTYGIQWSHRINDERAVIIAYTNVNHQGIGTRAQEPYT